MDHACRQQSRESFLKQDVNALELLRCTLCSQFEMSEEQILAINSKNYGDSPKHYRHNGRCSRESRDWIRILVGTSTPITVDCYVVLDSCALCELSDFNPYFSACAQTFRSPEQHRRSREWEGCWSTFGLRKRL